MVSKNLAIGRRNLAQKIYGAAHCPKKSILLAARQFLIAAKNIASYDKPLTTECLLGAANCYLDLGKMYKNYNDDPRAIKYFTRARDLFMRAERPNLVLECKILALCSEYNIDPGSSISKLALLYTFGKFEANLINNLLLPNLIKQITDECYRMTLILELQREALSLST